MYKLIIIDDDSFMHKHFVSGYNWENMGYKICASFTTAEECLAYLEKESADAIITDIKMPNMSGLELAQACLELYPQMPIILLSAFSSFEYAKQAIEYNVIDYLLKPIEDKELLRSLNKLTAYLEKAKFSEEFDMGDMSLTELSGENNIKLSQIKDYISENLSDNITVNDVANHAMINPKYFSFYFKKHTGFVFSTYLKNARMEKARDMLVNTDLKVSTIAHMVGYKITSPFFTYFSEKYGMTPTEYRTKFKK